MNIDQMTQAQLEGEIVAEPSLYAKFDETRLLNGGYTLDQMREVVREWITEAPDTAI